MDGRVYPFLGAGLAGLTFGGAAVLFGNPWLAVGSTVAALVASVIGLEFLRRLNLAEKEAGTAIDLLMTREVEHARNKSALARGGVDPITNLPDRTFFDLAVKGRVATARRHLWPVSVVLVEITMREGLGTTHPEVLSAFTDLMQETLRESDIACRVGDSTFGLVLEDTAEDGGVWTAERLQIAVAKKNLAIKRLAAGVATYPTHGLHADELMRRVNTALSRATANIAAHGLGNVEVAHSDPRQ